MIDMQQQAYTGVDNLEVMQEAVNYNRFLLDTVRKYAPSKARVLDFGAGSGQFAIPLRDHGLDIVALEPDLSLQQTLRARGLRVTGTPHDLPDAGFDYIYSLNVLEHIEDDAGALRALHSKLTSGGRLLIYVPAFPVLYTSMDAKVGHVRRYRKQALRKAAEAAGFAVDRVWYVDSLGFPATLAFKLLGNDSGNVNRTALKLYDRAVLPLSLALDLLTGHWFGKNLLLVARKP
ncbi:MAG TPA: class I SAM-dependent methyltransferase [Steroidobacter sp.]|uniref:class I SAM-dependent methyltransferase n=1 Tax=Steroidobacter sp. TaxID=1978227 RepID=UPI002EDA6666